MKNTYRPTSKRVISSAMLSIAMPVTLQNMAFYLQSFINTSFIGHYRVEGLSAINNAMIPFFMLFSFFIALSQGTTVLIAQSIGAGNRERARQVGECSLFYNQLLSFGYVLFWIVAGPKVLVAMGAQGEILHLASRYVQVMALVYITVGINITSASIFQGIGKTIPIMSTTLLRVGLNIIFDYLLIFGKLGCPEMGVEGAAWATVISTTISNGALFIILMHRKVLSITFQGILHPVKGLYSTVFRFGVKIGGEFLLWTGAQVALIRMLNQFDAMGAGLFGILNTLLGLSVNLYLGIGIAATSLVGKATGESNHHYAFRAGNICVAWSILLCFVVGIGYLFFPRLLLSIFTDNTDVIDRLLPLMRVVALISFPKAINVVIGNAIRGTGDARWMLITQTIGTIVIVSFAGYLLYVQHLGVAALVWANFGDEMWRSIVNYRKYFVEGRRKLVSAAIV